MSQNGSRVENRKTKKRGRKGLKYTLLILAIFILGAAGAGAYEYQRLLPKNHFNHLTAIGGTSNNGKGGKTSNQYHQKKGTFNVLLIGNDARKGDTASHTDSMVLIHADLKNHTYNMLSIPRDTRVHMDGYGYTKLTSVQYISQVKNGQKQGIIDAVKAISNLTGVPINYYAETNYWGLQDMVNSIGGITMNVPFQITLTHPWYKPDRGKIITKGTHSFDGRMVTEVVHERYSAPGTDYGRQQLQEAALIGIAKKVMDPSNVTRLPALSQSLSKFLTATNMSKEDMVSMALGVKGDFHPSKQIHYRQVKGKSEVRYDDILKANNDEVVLNPGQLKSVIKKYFTN